MSSNYFARTDLCLPAPELAWDALSKPCYKDVPKVHQVHPHSQGQRAVGGSMEWRATIQALTVHLRASLEALGLLVSLPASVLQYDGLLSWGLCVLAMKHEEATPLLDLSMLFGA